MTLLFSEKGSKVGVFDKDASAVKKNLEAASRADSVDTEKVYGFTKLEGLINACISDKPRLVVFSLPHGKTIDTVLEELLPLLKEGDVILDGSWYQTDGCTCAYFLKQLTDRQRVVGKHRAQAEICGRAQNLLSRDGRQWRLYVVVLGPRLSAISKQLTLWPSTRPGCPPRPKHVCWRR